MFLHHTVLQTKRGKATGQKNELEHYEKTQPVHPNLLMLFTFIPLLIFIKVNTFNSVLEMEAMYKLAR